MIVVILYVPNIKNVNISINDKTSLFKKSFILVLILGRMNHWKPRAHRLQGARGAMALLVTVRAEGLIRSVKVVKHAKQSPIALCEFMMVEIVKLGRRHPRKMVPTVFEQSDKYGQTEVQPHSRNVR